MRPTLNDYLNDNMGKKVRDGQCVALIRDCVEVVYGIPHTGSVEGAIDIWRTRRANPKILQYFHIVEGRPERGDIIFFNPTSSNKYGHVAIVLEDKGDGFIIADQDGLPFIDPVKYAGFPIGLKTGFWNWTRYAGALRPKILN